MDKLLLEAEKVDLTGEDVHNITNGECRILLYEDIQNIESLDTLFGDKDNVVILYETAKNFGHWVALLKYPDMVEFFDPYGLRPDEELKYADYNVRRNENGALIPHLSDLLNKSGVKLIYNSVKVQKWLKDVNTCGRHCALRIKMRKYPLGQYLALMMKNKYYDADLWATALTIIYSL